MNNRLILCCLVTYVFLLYLIHPPWLPFEVRGDELFIRRALENMLDSVLRRTVADDHDPLASAGGGIIAAEVVQKGLHARQGLVRSAPLGVIY